MVKKVFIDTVYKCCENAVFLSTAIENFFKINKYQIAKKMSEADFLVINGCNFVKKCREITEKKIRKALEVARWKKEGQVILTGCPALAERLKYGKIANISLIDYDNLEAFNQLFKNSKMKFNLDASKLSSSYYGIMVPDAYYVKIADGCINNCSYCTIKKGKGKLKSRHPYKIINEIKNIIKLGSVGEFPKIVLLADDCGSYGFDINTNIIILLKKLAGIRGNFKIYLHYFFPGLLIRFFSQLKNILDSGKICFINIPLQSADPKILKMMNRNYSINKAMRCIKFFRNNYPDLILHTHFIVNFPGETVGSFLKSLRAADYFDRSIFFDYSPPFGSFYKTNEKDANRKITLIKEKQKKEPFKYHFYDFSNLGGAGREKIIFVDENKYEIRKK